MAVKIPTPYPWARVGGSGGGGGGKLKAAQEVEFEANISRRVSLLTSKVPQFGDAPDQIVKLAMSSVDDDEMLTTAFNSINLIGLQSEVESLNGQPYGARIAQVDQMPRAKKDALIKAGLKTEQPGQGWYDRLIPDVVERNPALQALWLPALLKNAAPTALGPLKFAVTNPVSAFALKALNYPLQEVNRTTRVNEIMRSGSSVLDQTGMTQDQLYQQTGIKAPAFSNNDPSNMMGPGSVQGLLAGPGAIAGWAANHPTSAIPDLWEALKTWKEIGHKGEDDYLPESQYQAYSLIEDKMPGMGKDVLQVAISMANGNPIPQERQAELSKAYTDGTLKEAIHILESGRSSPGRSTTRLLWEAFGSESDPEMTSWASGSRYISGSLDMAWTLIADPILIGSKISKGAKLTKYAATVGDADKTLELQTSYAIAQKIKRGADVTEELEVIGKSPAKVLKDAKWSSEFVEDIANVFKTPQTEQNWNAVIKKYPGISPQIDNMVTYHEAIKEKSLGWFTNQPLGKAETEIAERAARGLEDPENVFEFVRHLTGQKNLVATADEMVTFDNKASLRLFGYDHRAKIFPHVSNVKRANLWTKDKFASWNGWQDLNSEIPTELKQLAKETVDDLDNVAVGQTDNSTAIAELEQAANELGLDDAAKSVFENSFDTANTQARELDSALSFRKAGFVKRQIGGFATAALTEVPRSKLLRLEGSESIEEARRVLKMVGVMDNSPQSLIENNINLWINGNTAQRHALTLNTFRQMLVHTGALDTPEGVEMFDKLILNSNKAFGFGDNVYNGTISNSKENLLAKMAIDRSQVADSMVMELPSYKELLIATRKANVMRAGFGTLRASTLEALISDVWKPAQLLRLSFPLRAGADEALVYIGKNGPAKYIRSAFLEPRAQGIAPFKPVRRLGNLIEEFAKTSDDALRILAQEKAAKESSGYVSAMLAGNSAKADELLKPFVDEAMGGRSVIPKSIKWASDMAHTILHTSDELFHEHVLRGSKPGENLARAILEKNPDYASRHAFITDAISSNPIMGNAMNEIVHVSIYERLGKDVDELSKSLMSDPNTKTGYRFVTTRGKRSNQAWIPSAADPTSFYMNRAFQLERLNSTPEGRAAIQTMNHYVEKSVLNEIPFLKTSKKVNDFERIQNLKDLRKLLQDEADRSYNGNISEMLTAAEDGKALGVVDESVTKVADGYSKLSAGAKRLLTDRNLNTNLLTNDKTFLSDVALNRIHDSYRRLDDGHHLRSSARASQVGGLKVIEPLPRDHIPLYGALIDRNQADKLSEILLASQDSEPTRKFFEALTRNLNNNGIYNKDKISKVWESLHPANTGSDNVSALATLKTQLIKGGGNYVPGYYGLSSDERIAYAIRDAIQETIGDSIISPTIGYIYQHKNTINELHGLKQLDDSVVAMSPHRAIDLNPLNPDNIQKFYKVKTEDGRFLTLAESELHLAGNEARARMGIPRPSTFDGLTRRGRDGGVAFNEEAIAEDFDSRGRSFIWGLARGVGKPKNAFIWDDKVTSISREQLVAQKETEFAIEYSNLKANRDSLIKQGNDPAIGDSRIAELEDPASFANLVDQAVTDGLNQAKVDINNRVEDLYGFLAKENIVRNRGEFNDMIKKSLDSRRGATMIAHQRELEDAGLFDEFKKLAKQATRSDGGYVVSPYVEAESLAVSQTLMEFGIDIPNFSKNLDLETYTKFLTARQKALNVLRPTGTGRYSVVTPEVLNRERDAVAFALNEIGYKPPITRRRRPRKTAWPIDSPFKGMLPYDKLDGGYEVLGTILGSGVTEDAALKSLSQDVLNEILPRITGAESGEIMSEVTSSLANGTFSQSVLWQRPIAEHGIRELQGLEVVPDLGWWSNLNNTIHETAFNPMIGAISRAPQMTDNLYIASEEYLPMLNNIRADADQFKAANEILAKFNLKTENLDKINSSLASRMLDDMKYAEDDIDANLVRAIIGKDASATSASTALETWAKENLGEGAGVGILDDTEFLNLQGWMRREASAHKVYHERSTTRAMDLTSAFIDDHTIRSQFQEYIGPVIAPYWYAEEQFLRRFARGMIVNPAMLRQGQLLMHGMRNVGVIKKDEHGNEIFVIPGSEILTSTVARAASLTGNDSFAVLANPLSMRTSFMLQGVGNSDNRFQVGPIAGLAISGIKAQHPEIEWRSGDNRSWWQTLVPGPANSLYEAFVKDPDPTQMASATASAYAILAASGHGLPDDPSVTEKQEFIDNVSSVVKAYGVGRALSGMLSFTKTVPVNQGGMFTKEFQDLLKMGLEYDEALTEFMKGKDPSAIAYTVFPTENLSHTPMASGSDAYKFMLENETLLQDAPEVAGWLIPGSNKDEFDPRAYNKQFALGLRADRKPQELIDLFQIRHAAPPYWKKRDEILAQKRGLQASLGLSKANDKIINQKISDLNDEWDIYSVSYRNRNPVFSDSLSSEGAKRRVKVIEDLLWMTDERLAFKDDERAREIRPLVLAYNDFKLKYKSYAGQTSKAARLIKKQQVDRFITDTWNLRKPNSVADEFWNSIIRPDLPEEAFNVESELKGV